MPAHSLTRAYPQEAQPMMLIRHVIKDREPYSMNASATVQDAAEFMASRNIGAVCVVDDAGKLLGVFSKRDVLRSVVVLRPDPLTVKVEDATSQFPAVINY